MSDFLKRAPSASSVTAWWREAMKGKEPVTIWLKDNTHHFGLICDRNEHGLMFMELTKEKKLDGKNYCETGNTKCRAMFVTWSSIDLVFSERSPVIIEGAPSNDK
jgi:hypothetical protein